MDEYIKREDALDAVLFALVGTGHQSKAIYAIRDVPTADVVAVVRCKDCRHCKFNSSCETYKCDRRGYYTETVSEDGFCSYGERRE